ncbi:MAG: glycosyltransferase family 39 protein [PVC group bacterium]
MGDFYHQRKRLFALAIFLLAFSLRAVLDLIFFSRSGWFSSHLIEVWYYYGVARGVYALSFFDPTYLLLRVPGLLLPGGILYQAVVFEAAVISALTAVLIFYWLNRRYGRSAGLWGGIVFALLPAPVTLSLVNFSHDLVQAPLVVLFFWSMTVAEQGGERRGRALAAAFACLLLGLMIGPLMAAALVIMLLYSIRLLFQRMMGHHPPAGGFALYLLGLVLLNYGLYLVMKPHLLEWIAPLALKFRGIDLLTQVRIRVGDLQPLPADALWNRYTLFIFFLPWGLWTAFRERDFFALTLFLFSLSLSLVVNRGARLLDLSVVLLSALAIRSWGKQAAVVTTAAVLLYIGIDLLFPGKSGVMYAGLPYGLLHLWAALPAVFDPAARPDPMYLRCGWLFTGFFTMAIVLSFLLRLKKSWPVGIALFLIGWLQGNWVMLAASTSTDQIEYEAYRWLDENSRPGEKIFAAWNQGYVIGALTRLFPVTTPERIDFSLTRLYWEEEPAAVRALQESGVRYVHVTSRYFGITAVNRENDTFTMRGNTIIGPEPVHIRRFSRMRRTLLFRLLYEPKTLLRFTSIYEKIDPEQKLLVRIFKVE